MNRPYTHLFSKLASLFARLFLRFLLWPPLPEANGCSGASSKLESGKECGNFRCNDPTSRAFRGGEVRAQARARGSALNDARINGGSVL